jgi:hypothetical protein
MAAVNKSADAGVDPTFRSASLNSSPLSAVLSKSQWNILVQEKLEEIAPWESIFDAEIRLSALVLPPQYLGLIQSIAQREPLSIPENNLKLEVQKIENELWYLRQARGYLAWFVKIIQDILERDSSAAEKPFDSVVRSNKKIIPETIMTAGKIINPVTQSVLSRESHKDHVAALDTARTLADSGLWANADVYIEYLTATGRIGA